MGLFGKTKTVEEYVKDWKRQLQKEERNLDRSIREIEVAEKKTTLEIKRLAKKKDTGAAKILAKELVRSRKARERLYTSKATLSGVSMQLTQQMATLKMQKTLTKSTQIMHGMNQLVKLPQLNHVMMAMSREMEKAGLIEETIDDVMEDPDIDEEADVQLDMVLDEILGDMPQANKSALPQAAVATAANAEEESDMSNRLAALKT